jgi:protein ImuA
VEIALKKREIAKQLQARINAMQGLEKSAFGPEKSRLTPFDQAFPGHVFPIGTIHEFISNEPADAACTSGFITALTGKLMRSGGLCFWIANERKIFPSGLKHFGLEPDRVIFINAAKQKDLLWIVEEALKCEALTAVVGEIKELGFTESRRLQLAVERSGVTGFIHRYRPRAENTVACTTRWKVTSLASDSPNGLPGIGYSCWDIQLLKVKNGKPNYWKVSWSNNAFEPIVDKRETVPLIERHAG